MNNNLSRTWVGLVALAAGTVTLMWLLLGGLSQTEPDSRTSMISSPMDEVLQYGYDASRNRYRWELMRPTLDMAESIRPEEEGPQPLLFADYGSNFGYFSLAMAMRYPKAIVLSLEGEIMKNYVKDGGFVPPEAAAVGEVAFHESLVHKYSLKNNPVCKAVVTVATIAALRMTRMTFDVQVAMSIFHWLPMKTQEEFELVLEAFVSLARVTILEFPQKHHGTQMNWQNILKWYGERDSAQEVIEWTLRHLPVNVTQLTPPNAFRPVFKIHHHKAYAFGRVAGRSLCDKLFSLFGCTNSLPVGQCEDPLHNFGRKGTHS